MVKVTHIPPSWFGENYYRILSHTDYNTVREWMRQNDVKYKLHTSGDPTGYGFTVKSNVEWFVLRWL